jgi:hypothetical protein
MFSARLYRIYPNWDFWLENIPSGNPDRNFVQSGHTEAGARLDAEERNVEINILFCSYVLFDSF